MALEWHEIDTSDTEFPQGPLAVKKSKGIVKTYRAAVHGGWLVRTITDLGAYTEGLTFVPDPNHEWK